MPVFGPISRQNLVRYLKQLEFKGPMSGGKPEFMLKDRLKLILPNPHGKDIGKNFLHAILKEAGISKSEWEKL